MTGIEPPALARITEVEVLHDFVVRLTFSDGVVGEVNLETIIWGEVFEPHRRDPSFFRRVYVDPVCRTICWPNDTDLDPDVLYARVTGTYDELVKPGGPWAEPPE